MRNAETHTVSAFFLIVASYEIYLIALEKFHCNYNGSKYARLYFVKYYKKHIVKAARCLSKSILRLFA